MVEGPAATEVDEAPETTGTEEAPVMMAGLEGM